MAVAPHLTSVNNQSYIGEVNDSPTAPSAGGPPRGNGDTPTGSGRAASRQRAERNLPTDRLGFDKQIAALKVIAQLSGDNRRAVSSEDISAHLGLKGNTGGLSNKFFADTGWIVRQGRASYVATEELIDFHRHLGFNPDDEVGAKRYLLGPAQASWYWQELSGMVAGQGVPERVVLHTLSKAASAPIDRQAQLQLIVEWLLWLGLVRRESERIVSRVLDDKLTTAAEPRQPEAPASAEEATDDDLQGEDTVEVAVKPAAPAAVDDALLSFNVSIRIRPEDAANMSDERLNSLLAFVERVRGQ